ncbi:MFS transporter [Komagataeibacter sp. FXV2]|nr:MFS transporter [Komagataeibacter sp. FXV2]
MDISPPDDRSRVLMRLTAALFLGYLAVALSLPVIPVYVTQWPGYGNMLAGLAVGIAFASTIISRNHAGQLADGRGGRTCMRLGLAGYILAGLICAGASLPILPYPLRYLVLVAGRLVLGVGESLTVVGMLGWGIGLMGHARAGKVMAWTGMAMYGAFAVGAPLGLAIFHMAGFGGVMLTCAILPAAGLLLSQDIMPSPIHDGRREPFWHILGRIWQPGCALGLQGVGFAALGTFISLYFMHRNWPHAGLGLTCFGGAFVAVRVLCGHLPDRVGGVRVALASLMVEATGQYLLWCAPSPTLALVGAVLTGMGCSMVYPALGVEVVRIMPPHLRGTALGGFAAFQDLAYGATGPLTGLLADRTGYASVFLVGGICATLAFLLTLHMATRRR